MRCERFQSIPMSARVSIGVLLLQSFDLAHRKIDNSKAEADPAGLDRYRSATLRPGSCLLLGPSGFRAKRRVLWGGLDPTNVR
jgi:hypothetical protein